jgi:hypothetical protein
MPDMSGMMGAGDGDDLGTMPQLPAGSSKKRTGKKKRWKKK